MKGTTSFRKKSAVVLFGVMTLGLSAHMMASAVSEIGDAGNKNSQNYKFLSLGEKEKQNSKEKAENQNNNQSSVASSGINKKSRTSTQEQTQEIKNRIQEIRISLIPACLIVNGFLLMLAMLYWFNGSKSPENKTINNRKRVSRKPFSEVYSKASKKTKILNEMNSTKTMDSPKGNNKITAHIKSNQKKINQNKFSNDSTNFLNTNNNDSNNIIISENYNGNKDDDKVKEKYDKETFFDSLLSNKFGFKLETTEDINQKLSSGEYYYVRSSALYDFEKQFKTVENDNEGLTNLETRVVEFRKKFYLYLRYSSGVEFDILKFVKPLNEFVQKVRDKKGENERKHVFGIEPSNSY